MSSAVTMTAFEPVLAAYNACKRKRVSASSCVDCSSATSTYSSSPWRLPTMPCLAAYICIAVVSTRQPRNWRCSYCSGIFSTDVCCVNPCNTFVLKGCACPSVYSFSIFDGRLLAVNVKDNTNPANLSTHIHYHGQDILCVSCANLLLLPFILCTRSILSMIPF